MDYHSNYIYFLTEDDQPTIKSGTYEIHAHSITSGQDPDHHIENDLVLDIKDGEKIDFDLGRQGSNTVSDWFKDEFSSDQNTFNKDPKGLNFAFRGTLILNLSNGDIFKFKDVGLAQGNDLINNNWWFATQSAHYIGDNKITFMGSDQNGNLVNAVAKCGSSDLAVDQVKFYF